MTESRSVVAACAGRTGGTEREDDRRMLGTFGVGRYEHSLCHGNAL